MNGDYTSVGAIETTDGIVGVVIEKGQPPEIVLDVDGTPEIFRSLTEAIAIAALFCQSRHARKYVKNTKIRRLRGVQTCDI